MTYIFRDPTIEKTKKTKIIFDDFISATPIGMRSIKELSITLAYPDFFKVFEIYTSTSSKQLGAVITQENRPIAFFSWKLSTMQRKYSVTKIELLAIVETLKEFKGMIRGQSIKVYTDHAFYKRCSRHDLRPCVLMKVIAGRVRARDCLH